MNFSLNNSLNNWNNVKTTSSHDKVMSIVQIEVLKSYFTLRCKSVFQITSAFMFILKDSNCSLAYNGVRDQCFVIVHKRKLYINLWITAHLSSWEHVIDRFFAHASLIWNRYKALLLLMHRASLLLELFSCIAQPIMVWGIWNRSDESWVSVSPLTGYVTWTKCLIHT